MNALVAGIDGTLGTALGTALAEANYTVYGTALEPQENERIFTLDITHPEDIAALASKLPPLKFLTCTIASPPRVDRFERFTDKDFEDAWRVNVAGQIALVRALLPRIEQGGVIVFIASEVTVNDHLTHCAPYTVSKYALVGVGAALAAELAPKNIRVITVSPGMMDTPFLKHVPSAMPAQYLKRSGRVTFLTPTEVAKQILTLSTTGETGKNYPIL